MITLNSPHLLHLDNLPSLAPYSLSRDINIILVPFSNHEPFKSLIKRSPGDSRATFHVLRGCVWLLPVIYYATMTQFMLYKNAPISPPSTKEWFVIERYINWPLFSLFRNAVRRRGQRQKGDKRLNRISPSSR